MYSYVEFTIEIRRGPDTGFGPRISVDCTKPDHGQPPTTDAEWTIESVSRLVPAATAEQRMALGDVLGECMFPPRVLGAFHETIDSLGDDTGIRIRLVCRDEEMSRWPWELARVDVPSRDMSRYLFRHSRFSLVRGVIIDRPVNEPQYRRELVILPVDATKVLAGAELLPDFPAGLADIRRFRRLSVPRPTKKSVEEVIDEIQAGDDPLDVFHFTGHGKPPRNGQAGALVLYREENDSGARDYRSDELARSLDRAGTSLAFINACYSGDESVSGDGLGIAQSLTGIVPVVVAVRDAVADQMAQKFADVFYRWLLDGSTVDEAVARGRGALDETAADWGHVVLYSRASRGRFLEPAPQAAEPGPPVVTPQPTPPGARRWSMLAGPQGYWLLVPGDQGPELRPAGSGPGTDITHLRAVSASLALSADGRVAAQLNGRQLALAWVDRVLPRLDRWPGSFELPLAEPDGRLLAVTVDYVNDVVCLLSTDRATYRVDISPDGEPDMRPLVDAPSRCAVIRAGTTLTVDMDGQLRGRELNQRIHGISEVRFLDAARSRGQSLSAVAGLDDAGKPIVAAAWSAGQPVVWRDTPADEVVIVRPLSGAHVPDEVLAVAGGTVEQLRMGDAP